MCQRRHGELLVVRVVPLVVCDDAVVRRTLVLIAFTVAIVFIVAILRRILQYWRYSVYTHRRFFFCTHGIDESVKASRVSATEEKCKK